ncbi:MAG TPA: FUSC family protein [Rhodanobacteraceae bacterium]
MSDGAYSLRASLVTTLSRFKRPDVPIPVALRNTAAVILPLAIGFACQHVEVGLGVSLGALVVMFADQPGPYRQRLLLITGVTVAAALSGLVGFLVGGHLALGVLAVALWGLMGGMLVLYGPGMARVGMTSMILLVVATSEPMHWRAAIDTSGLILAGGILQALFSIAAWPLQRYLPERLALATLYRDLARQACRQPGADEAPPATDTLTVLQRTLLGRAPLHGRAMEAFHTLLELAERMRLEWVALAEMVPDEHADLAIFRRRASKVLQAIAEALDKAEPPTRAERTLKALTGSGQAYVDSLPTLPPVTARHLHALTGQLAAAVRNTRWAGARGEIRARHADTSMPHALRNVAPLATLRANLGLSSSAFRHALRCAVVLALALIVAHLTGLGRGYWVAMTAAIVLRPDFGATFNTGLLRVLGTLLGLVLTTALLHLAPDSAWAHLALMAVLCFAFRYLATAHYGVAVIALTGTVVILLSFEGTAPSAAVVERVINTAIGSAMALAAYLVWPTWERGRARDALANMLTAYAHYLGTLTRRSNALTRRDARTAARAARSNAQASLERLRTEPTTSAALLDQARALLASGNRLARTIMSFEALLDEGESSPACAAAGPFVEQSATALLAIATALREHRPPDSLPALRDQQRALAAQLARAEDAHLAAAIVHICDCLTDNIDTLAHVASRGFRMLLPDHRQHAD